MGRELCAPTAAHIDELRGDRAILYGRMILISGNCQPGSGFDRRVSGISGLQATLYQAAEVLPSPYDPSMRCTLGPLPAFELQSDAQPLATLQTDQHGWFFFPVEFGEYRATATNLLDLCPFTSGVYALDETGPIGLAEFVFDNCPI